MPPDAHETDERAGASPARARLARLLEGAAFYGSLALVVLAAIPYGSVESWWGLFFAAAVFWVASLWAFHSLLAGGWGLRRGHLTLLLPALALVLFSLLQTVPLSRDAPAGARAPSALWHALSADPFETRLFAFKLATLTLLCALLLRFTASRRRLHALVLLVVGLGAASAVFGILRQASQQGGEGFVLPYLQKGIGYAQIISRNQFAFMMEMALGLALGMIVGRGGRRDRRLVYLSLALPIGAALILANSRAGILTMLCQLLFLALLAGPLLRGRAANGREPGRWQRTVGSLVARTLLVAALVAVVAVAVVWVGGDPVVSNLGTVTEDLSADQQETMPPRWNTSRAEIWEATWRIFKDRPLAGAGFGGYWVAVAQYHDASGAYTPQQAHNDYLELLASGGLVGVALALWLVFAVLVRTRAALRRGDNFRRAACFGALVGAFGVAVHSLVDFGLHLTINAALFVVLVVIATADVTDENGVGAAETWRQG